MSARRPVSRVYWRPLKGVECHYRRRRQDEPYGNLGTARHSGETGIPACETARGERRRPESQPESRPESLRARVIRQLADGPMSKANLSRSLGQKKISGQLNKVIRLLVVDGSIEYTIPEKPQSRLQKYRLMDRGRVAVERLSTQNAGAWAQSEQSTHETPLRTHLDSPLQAVAPGSYE